MSSEKKQAFIELSMEIDDVVNRSVAEHSINPVNIETEIQKSLLPKLFKTLGGLDKAKAAIQHIVQIVRHGSK